MICTTVNAWILRRQTLEVAGSPDLYEEDKAEQDANAEVDRLREELTPKVKKMNDLMTLVKASYAESKKTLKGYYPQERWPDYGIPDKR